MPNSLISFLAVFITAAVLNGCSSKVGHFVAANVSPLPQNEIQLSDGYKATYYYYKKGDVEDTDTLLFFIGGSGHASLNYYLRPYFKGLNDNVGIYALQKRYIGHRETGVFEASEKFHQFNYFSQWLKDQREFVNRILEKHDDTVKNIVIFGVSEGGNTAAALASEISQITHLVILGSGGMKGIDEFRLWGKNNNIDFDSFYQEVNKYPESIEKRGVGKTYKYWASVLPVEPMDYFKKIDVPILVAIGEKDEMVPIESVNFLADEFKKLRKHNLTVKIFPDCNHVLTDTSGKSHRSEFLQYAYTWWSNK